MPSAPHKRHIEIQDRDLEILRGLFESRIMTAQHVADLYFDGRYEAARKRLQGLKGAGYVGERPRKVYEQAVLFMTRKAFAVLCERGKITDYPRLTWANLEKRVRVSDLTLRHELAVMDVKAGIAKAVRQTDHMEVAEFSTWPVLYQFEAASPSGERVTVKPDGFIRIRETARTGESFEHTFFLELDRSSEPQNTLELRAACYRDYYQRGGFAARFGYAPSEFGRLPFRVFVVFINAERRNNFAERLLLLRPPILTQIWLATLSEVTRDPLGSIWVRPADYRAVISGTAYGPDGRANSPVYRRQPDLQALIEGSVVKHRPFRTDVHPAT